MNYTPQYLNDLTVVQSACPNLESIKESSVLVTGSTGLVCSAIVDFLLNYNDTCRAMIKVYIAARSVDRTKERFGELLNRSDVEFVEYDALVGIDWSFDVDYIIHGASPANPILYANAPVETMLANLRGIDNILLYAKKHHVKRVLFVSSSEVYGLKSNSAPYMTDEYGYIDILNPRACYPSAKRACETLCIAYLFEYSVNSVIVRLGHVYGPTATRNDSRASSQFFYDVLDGNDIVMKSSGNQLRSYCYVIDCVSAILTVLINGDAGKAYNVSNPSSIVTIRELAEEIAKCSKCKLRFDNPSDEEKRGYNLMDNSSLDSSLLLELGWYGSFDLKEGVYHTLGILKNSI